MSCFFKRGPGVERFYKCCSHRPVAGRSRRWFCFYEDGPQGRGYSGAFSALKETAAPWDHFDIVTSCSS